VQSVAEVQVGQPMRDTNLCLCWVDGALGLEVASVMKQGAVLLACFLAVAFHGGVLVEWNSEVAGEVRGFVGCLVGGLDLCVANDAFHVLNGLGNTSLAALLQVFDRPQLSVGPLSLGTFHWLCASEGRLVMSQTSEWV